MSVLVLIKSDFVPVPGRGYFRVVCKRGKAWHVFPDWPILGLDQEASSIICEKLNPRVADPVASLPPKDNAGVISQREKLAPSPKCEVLTIAFSSLFEVFRRLPVVEFTELLHVTDTFAAGQELADIADCFAFHSERLAHISAHWKGRVDSVPP